MISRNIDNDASETKKTLILLEFTKELIRQSGEEIYELENVIDDKFGVEEKISNQIQNKKMKRKSVVLSLLLYLSICGYANTDPNKYQYTVDLTRVENDKLLVELKTPIIESSTTTFYFPKIIPGTYKLPIMAVLYLT